MKKSEILLDTLEEQIRELKKERDVARLKDINITNQLEKLEARMLDMTQEINSDI